MKCNIVMDLLPLYQDDLCTEQSRHDIEEHLAGCKSCSNSFKNASADFDISVESADEKQKAKPFIKLKKKLKKNKVITIVVSVVSVAIIGMLGIMTYGQINKIDEIPNFEKMVMHFDAKNYVEMLFEGDISGFITGINLDGTESLVTDVDKIVWDCHDNLVEYYDSNLKDSNVEIEVLNTFYYDASSYVAGLNTERIGMYCDIKATIEGVGDMVFTVSKVSPDGGYRTYVDTEDCALPELASIINYCQGFDSNVAFDKIVAALMISKEDREYRTDKIMLTNRYGIAGVEKISKFIDDGTKIIDCVVSIRGYDKDLKLMYETYTLTVEDTQGNTAVLVKKAYNGYDLDYIWDIEKGTAYGNLSDEKMAELEILLDNKMD